MEQHKQVDPTKTSKPPIPEGQVESRDGGPKKDERRERKEEEDEQDEFGSPAAEQRPPADS
jgi:hypothetical protein